MTWIKELRCPHVKEDGKPCGRLLCKYSEGLSNIQIKCNRCKTIFDISEGENGLTIKELTPVI